MKIDKIHEDNRGEIFAVTGKPLQIPEVSFMSCHAGFARGGCIHRKNTEHLCVIEGVMNYYYALSDNLEDMRHITLKAGQTFSITPNTPHFMLALMDCIFIEWGCEEEEKKEKYIPFRKIVDDINSGLTNQ